jgi:hypothetical protein
MEDFKPGKFYDFVVTEIKEENDKKYIYLSDGFRDTFRVHAYDFQTEWEPYNLKKVINCLVKDVNIWGLPLLVQNKKDILQQCYTDIDQLYTFKVIEVKNDPKTNAIFYELRDSFGLNHRFYPHDKENLPTIAEQIDLIYKGIIDKGGNNVILNLSLPTEEIKALNEPVEDVKILTTVCEHSLDAVSIGSESYFKEFKSSIVFPAGTTNYDIDRQMSYILKTIAGFQNAKGGELYIGVNDHGVVTGINDDYKYLNTSKEDTNIYKEDNDGYENKIRSIVKKEMGSNSNSGLDFKFMNEDSLTYLKIIIQEMDKPIFVNGIKLFERAGNMTQLLKGDEITYFIEKRLSKRKNRNIDKIEVIKEDSFNIDQLPRESRAYNQNSIVKPNIKLNIDSIVNVKEVIYYLTFYKDNMWSFQKKSLNNTDVLYEIPIYKDFRKGRIVMVYENGKVNTVIFNDLIKNKNNQSKSKKTEGKKYSNSTNTNSKLMFLQCLPDDYLLVFRSKLSNVEYIKAHKISDISDHVNLNAEGNTLANGAQIVDIMVVPEVMGHFISEIRFKSHQTSSTLGIKVEDRKIKNIFPILEEINEIFQSFWKKLI